MSRHPTQLRRRNRKGEGALLRDELVAAATAVLVETGDERRLSIREVAHRAGVSPPAVYLQFEGKEALVTAVLQAQFAALTEAVGEALADSGDPPAALRDGCRAYLRFARSRPGSYRLLFGGHTPLTDTPRELATIPGRSAFDQLVAGIESCQAAGTVPPGDAVRTATMLWVGLHGIATLRQARPDFPWPDPEELLDDLLERVAGLPRP